MSSGGATGTQAKRSTRGLGQRHAAVSGRTAFLPGLVDRYVQHGDSPMHCRLTTLFVDMAGSTSLYAHHSSGTVLRLIQRFMRVVTESALAHRGDVKDFEGDGALLYFACTACACEAALAIQAALASEAGEGSHGMRARMSLTVGQVVLGMVGSRQRKAMALVGPSVPLGARLLKHISPGAIIASGAVVEELRADAPGLAALFELLDPACSIPGAEPMTVTTYGIVGPPHPPPAGAHTESVRLPCGEKKALTTVAQMR